MSFKIEHPTPRLALTLAAGALILWGFYLRTLSPAFPPDDSAETISAAFSLGIQHPPGYPLAALLGRCAIVALPLGGVAFRVNLLSAALACLTAVLAGWLTWRLAEGDDRSRRAAAIAAMLALGSLAVYWDQATEAKGGLYLLNLALGFGAWLAALSRDRRSPWAWSLLAGLMLANHYPSAVLWLLPSGLWVFWRQRAERRALLALLPGLSLYLYLPLRALHAPALNWGEPSTWGQFWWMLSRGGYSQAGVTDHGATAWAQAQLWLSSLRQPGWAWVALFSVFGAWALWRQRKAFAQWLLAAIGLALLAALLVNKTPADNRWLCLIFALPATALLAPLAGIGSQEILKRWWPKRAWVGAPMVLVLGVMALLAQQAKADRSGSFVAWDYGHDLALSLPKGAIYLAEGDFHLMPLLEAQVVEGRRRDLLLVLNNLSGEAWYQRTLLRQDAGLLLPPKGPAESASLELARLNASRRPLAISPYSVMLTPQRGVPQHQRGLPKMVGPARLEADVAAAWAARPPQRSVADWEPIEAQLVPWYAVALAQTGNEALGLKRYDAAILAFRRALERPGPKPEGPLAYNLGLVYEAAHRQDLALLAYQRCVRVDASFAPGAERLQALTARP